MLQLLPAAFVAVAVKGVLGDGFLGGLAALVVFAVALAVAEEVARQVEAGRRRRRAERSRAATAEWLASHPRGKHQLRA